MGVQNSLSTPSYVYNIMYDDNIIWMNDSVNLISCDMDATSLWFQTYFPHFSDISEMCKSQNIQDIGYKFLQ